MILKILGRHGLRYVCIVKERYKIRLRYLTQVEVNAPRC